MDLPYPLGDETNEMRRAHHVVIRKRSGHARLLSGGLQRSLTWPGALLTRRHSPDKVELKTLLAYSSPRCTAL